MPYRRGLILFWNGKPPGIAACDGMHTPLPRKPRVLELDIDQIDYAPGVGQHWVSVVGKGWRYLSAAEQAYIDAALERMVKSGIDEICVNEAATGRAGNT